MITISLFLYIWKRKPTMGRICRKCRE